MAKKQEPFFCIGFSEDKKKILSYCLSPQISDKIFHLESKRGSITDFALPKKHVRISYPAKKDIAIFTEDDFLAVSAAGKKNIAAVLNGSGRKKKLLVFSGKSAGSWAFAGAVAGVSERGIVIPDFSFKKKSALLFGEHEIKIAYSADLKKWMKQKEAVLKPRPAFFDKEGLGIVALAHTDRGIFVLYDCSEWKDGVFFIRLGAAILGGAEGKNILWRSNTPVFEHTLEEKLSPKGAVFSGGRICTYWAKGDGSIVAFSFYNHFGAEVGKMLSRHEDNPILAPIGKKWHEAGTFNPTAVKLGDDIHLVYRAIGGDGISKFGYAKADESGLNIAEVYPGPIFAMREPRRGIPENKKIYSFMMYPSGGSWGGAEDPRMVAIGGRVYLTFNSFEGWDSIRVGIVSISEDDFKNKIWNWTEPILISPAREVNKNWVLFPEKIGGKFAILHSISPHIQIEYVDDFDKLASGQAAVKSKWVKDGGPKGSWDTFLRGAGPAPLKTKDGWLVFYHATNKIGGGYAMGAMLLDLKNPEKIVARSAAPILLPDAWYENDWKPGVVYACGSVIKNGMIYVYYGGGDKHVCVATAKLDGFLTDLKKNKKIGFEVKNVSFA